MGHRDANGRRLRWTNTQKRFAKMQRERTNQGGPSTMSGGVHLGMQKLPNPNYHKVPMVNNIQKSESNFFFPAVNDKPMPWNYPIESDPVIGMGDRTTRVKIDLHSLPRSIFEEISKILTTKEKLYFLTSSRSGIEAWGGKKYANELRQCLKNGRLAYQGWYWWCRYGKAFEARENIQDRYERALAAREHFKRFNEKMKSNKMSISEVAKIFNVYQGEIREIIDDEHWDEFYADDDDIMQQ